MPWVARESRAAVELLTEQEKSALVLEISPCSSTGYTNVTRVGDKFQARLQVPGDGRGGMQKRRQHALPGLFATAKDAAVLLACYKQLLKEQQEDEDEGWGGAGDLLD